MPQIVYALQNAGILDVSLPDGSGFDFCKKIRSTSKVPIMFLTAADEETDIIMGLDIGGDDYITKPFKLAIFLSRLNALLRRSENFNTEVTELTSNDISIRLLKGEVYKQGKNIKKHFLFRAEQEGKEICLSGNEEIKLLCDRNWIIEAISNLVKNALDHTEKGGLIRIEWRAFTSIVQISVKDNGSGIHPDDLYHIFKRFYRSRFSKDTQGIGLGLSLTKAIVEAHNGTIEVDSTVGMGTSFTINFLNPTKL